MGTQLLFFFLLLLHFLRNVRPAEIVVTSEEFMNIINYVHITGRAEEVNSGFSEGEFLVNAVIEDAMFLVRVVSKI